LAISYFIISLNSGKQQKEIRTNNNTSSRKITRRGFLGSVLGLWGAVLSLPVIYAFIEYLAPPRKKFKSYSERLNPESKIQEISLEKISENSSLYVTVEDEPVLLIRGEGEKIIALSAVCTHLDCLVGYRKSNNDIFCKCHSSSFSLEGTPVEGPAKKPLPKYKVEIKDRIAYISSFENN
jgi:cytochrome b6-f complex iron-sulfur subunit